MKANHTSLTTKSRSGIYMMALLCSALLLVAGCNKREWLKMKGELKDPINVLSVHQIVKFPMAKRIERRIDTFSGQKVWININSLLHSDVIKKIELIPRNDQHEFYDLKLFLNHKGRIRWLQLSNGYAHEKLGVVVDGIFYRSFVPKPMVGDLADGEKTYVVIEGPFDEGTAKSLEKHAEDNYLFYNDDDVEP
ncbi:MAG: hypothetical protein GXP32_08195 [Kiritimatiellaeota bacterium]|nr:hypothetical protein [Kiritimatiellota bacterium]